MATVRSTWAHQIIPNNGLIAAAHWMGAGILPMRDGTLSVKNDATRVYIALDVMSDKAEGPLTNEYYWFVVDMGAAAKQAGVFSPWPGHPNRLGLWMMEGPNILPAIPPSTSHRTWTVSLDLADLGITLNARGNAGSPALLKFGLRPVSATPAFTDDSPSNPISDFADFDRVVLAMPPVANMTGMIDVWRLRPNHSLSI